jgi:beta-galactosidase
LVAPAHGDLSEPEPAFGLFSVHLRHNGSVRSNAAPDYQANRAAPVREPQRLSNHDKRGPAKVCADFVSYDSYPEFKVCDLALPARFRDRSESRLLSRMRGVSAKFMVLEQQSGPSGQIGGVLNGNLDYLHPTPKPGQMRLWCWNSIAHGADGLLFFRWRSLPYGSEAHWNGLLYHDERNVWRLEEAKQLGGEIKRLSSTLTGSRCASQAAILYDFDNESHARIERQTANLQ